MAINAKYIHTSLAIRSIYKYCEELKENLTTKEFTINNNEDYIINEIYKEKPDLIGFSCYIWNIEMILDIISTLKKILPNTKIFLGGPEASYEYEYLFKKGIDLIAIGEGEKTVKEIILAFNKKPEIDERFKNIKGVAFPFENEIFVSEEREQLDLNDIPFVYDDLKDTENKILYYEASRGCPYTCQYCLSSLEKGLRFLEDDRVKSDLQFFLDNKVKQVKFVDRTFNCRKKYAIMIWEYLIENDNNITNFHFEISADILDDDMINVLKRARLGLFQFEIGIQSTNDITLNEIKRKTNLQKLFEKVLVVKDLKNIHQHLDLIAGLPNESYEIFKKSFNDVFNLYPEQFQLGFLKLLRGSGLRANAEKYGIIYKEKAPYEVLFTKYISYDEMSLLKDIENMVEIYYNSGKAINTIKYSLNYFKTPFDFFETLAKYWKEKGFENISHNKMKLYQIIFEFLFKNTQCEKDILKEIIKFDIYLNDNIKSLPDWIENEIDNSFKEKEKLFYNNEENIKKYLPHFIDKDSKHISRICHFGKFSIDIDNLIKSNFKEVIKNESYILFDYYTKNDLVYKVKKHFLKEGDI